MNSNTLRNRRTKRTTITLEADVADYIQDTLKKDKSLKEKHLINKLLRTGIKNEINKPKTTFRIKGFKSSLVEGTTAETLEEMLDEV
ncbi:MAG TPA: hypothetical protein PKY59_01370 [Pyrinomonadaceae bacterium]|nr:hypothetical protein [Pyrinomonadaceae bacterium]